MRQTKKEMLQGIEDKVQSSRIIGNNTLGVFYKDGTEAIRFHNTDILFVKDGIVTLNSGGWKTATTKDRINGFLRHFDVPFYIQQRNHQWFIAQGIFYRYLTVDGDTAGFGAERQGGLGSTGE